MYEPKPLGDGLRLQVIALAIAARGRTLAIVAGAGLSRAMPSSLPLGAELANRVHARLTRLVTPMPACNPDVLTSIADAVEAVAGVGPVQTAMRQAADFVTADPNHGHRVLALLLAEGAVEVVVLNWDDCIERGSPSLSRLQAVVTDADWAQMQGARVLKIHGCATRPPSILVTTQQLANPPVWVTTHLAATLPAKTVVFLGLGDVPGYFRPSVERAVANAGGFQQMFVVGPGIPAAWAGTAWAAIAPLLPDANKLDFDAEGFLDDLLRAYVRLRLEDLRDAVDGPLRVAMQGLINAVGGRDGLTVAIWLRASAFRWRPGDSLVDAPETTRALLALALLARPGGLQLHEGGRFMVGDRHYILLIAHEKSASQVARDGLERARQARAGRYAEAPTITVVCAGQLGTLAQTVGESVVGDDAAGSVIDGSSSAVVRFESVEAIIATA